MLMCLLVTGRLCGALPGKKDERKLPSEKMSKRRRVKEILGSTLTVLYIFYFHDARAYHKSNCHINNPQTSLFNAFLYSVDPLLTPSTA